jgi:histidyl-tRNA synthetase
MISETSNPNRPSRSQESWLRQRNSQDTLLHFFGSYGYRFVDTPILEPTDLFLRKSGGELASQMFSFLDPASNPLSLRPEFTAPIMLHCLEHAADIDLPARWQYAGPVFRYGLAGHQGTGQFTQIGAELIGSSSVLADAELLDLAARAPERLGLARFTLELADLQVLHCLLDTVELSDRARTFIVGAIPQLRTGNDCITQLLEQARHLHLTGHDTEDADLSAAIAGLDDQRAREVLKGFLGWTSGEVPQLGQRDPDEVVHRLLRKLRGTDDRGSLEQGLKLAADLVAIRGEPGVALDSARRVMAGAGARSAPLDRLADLVGLLQEDLGLANHLALDFGLARGIAYYTGIIFEVTHPSRRGSLGGGGRYDALARALGSPRKVPAAGFAYSLEALLELVDDQGAAVDDRDQPGKGAAHRGLLAWESSALIMFEDPPGRREALLLARELRGQGVQAELEVGGRSLPQALAYAGRRGMDRVVSLDREGRHTEHRVG